MIKLKDIIETLHDNTRVMIFSDRDEEHIIFGGYREDMSGLFKGLYENDEVIQLRTIFKDLWIKIKEV